MGAPIATDRELASYLQQLEDRVSRMETPLGPTPVFACTTANMPAAVGAINMVLRNTTLNILAVSDGVNWIRQDTGGVI